MIPSVESIHNAVEALGTLWAGKSIGLVGAITAMKDNIEETKDKIVRTTFSGPVVVALVISLLGGTFALGGIYKAVSDTKEDTNEQIDRLYELISDAKEESNAQISTIIENANSNSKLLADSFANQLDLSHKLFNSELEKRDIKLNIAYESANQGPRHTLAMATKHKEEDDTRYYQIREQLQEQEHNCEETREHVREIREQHAGLGYHPNGKSE